MGRLPSLGEEEEAVIDEQQQYQSQLSEAESVDPHAPGGGGSLVSAALGIIKGMVGPGKSAFVLFFLVLLCVQYEVLVIWLLHLAFIRLCLTAFTPHALIYVTMTSLSS